MIGTTHQPSTTSNDQTIAEALECIAQLEGLVKEKVAVIEQPSEVAKAELDGFIKIEQDIYGLVEGTQQVLNCGLLPSEPQPFDEISCPVPHRDLEAVTDEYETFRRHHQALVEAYQHHLKLKENRDKLRHDLAQFKGDLDREATTLRALKGQLDGKKETEKRERELLFKQLTPELWETVRKLSDEILDLEVQIHLCKRNMETLEEKMKKAEQQLKTIKPEGGDIIVELKQTTLEMVTLIHWNRKATQVSYDERTTWSADLPIYTTKIKALVEEIQSKQQIKNKRAKKADGSSNGTTAALVPSKDKGGSGHVKRTEGEHSRSELDDIGEGASQVSTRILPPAAGISSDSISGSLFSTASGKPNNNISHQDGLTEGQNSGLNSNELRGSSKGKLVGDPKIKDEYCTVKEEGDHGALETDETKWSRNEGKDATAAPARTPPHKSATVASSVPGPFIPDAPSKHSSQRSCNIRLSKKKISKEGKRPPTGRWEVVVLVSKNKLRAATREGECGGSKSREQHTGEGTSQVSMSAAVIGGRASDLKATLPSESLHLSARLGQVASPVQQSSAGLRLSSAPQVTSARVMSKTPKKRDCMESDDDDPTADGLRRSRRIKQRKQGGPLDPEKIV
ncbi:hypothetical protein HK102_006456 [Quaeritorhiza haematococci]|nr:hypothetical protein HK102_006456 [Quaeritorhiza haematococci]